MKIFRAFMICSLDFSLIALSKELYYAAIYFMLFALLMQLISMEKKKTEITNHITVNNQSGAKPTDEQISEVIGKAMMKSGGTV